MRTTHIPNSSTSKAVSTPIPGRLCSVARPLALRAKSAAVLAFLERHPGRLVTRQELLRAVWPSTFVSKVVLRVCIAEVRAALKSSRATLTTLPRLGYRFDPAPSPHAIGAHFVGREQELDRLHGALARTASRQRQIVFVSGEAGIGKTALVDRFLDEVRVAGMARVAYGQCLDLHGNSEGYAPLLDLLDRLCDEPRGEEVVRVLAQRAPSWLIQMPARIDIDAAESLRRRISHPSPQRMVRELSQAIEALSRDGPLVLVLRDLHWSDASTLDALAHLGQRDASAALLVVASYGPHESRRRGSPFEALRRQLHARGLCSEIALRDLTLDAVEEYLLNRLSPWPLDDGVAGEVFRYSGGRPSFLVALVEHLLERELLRRTDGSWRLDGSLDGVVPETIEKLAGETLDSLDDAQRHVVHVASVIGSTFSIALLAEATGLPTHTVEDACAALAARQHLAHADVEAASDRIAGTRYEFCHPVFREAIRQQLTASRWRRLHRAVAERLVAACGTQRGDAATALPVGSPSRFAAVPPRFWALLGVLVD
jgi:predicted ATPase